MSIYKEFIGKYVICRSRVEGLNAGFVVNCDETGVILSEARRLWYHGPQKGAWYEAIALYGLSKDSKISEPATKLISEDYSLTIVNDAAKESILSVSSYEG